MLEHERNRTEDCGCRYDAPTSRYTHRCKQHDHQRRRGITNRGSVTLGRNCSECTHLRTTIVRKGWTLYFELPGNIWCRKGWLLNYEGGEKRWKKASMRNGRPDLWKTANHCDDYNGEEEEDGI